ncbi:hypothetical protein Scep_009773 [Stephania cephalantha]|uniref:Uncharacterized protein n=1 Tax=Stephania cephalantha TaxID=152367 RepID=A0AAP0PDG3_9MAGN
MHQLVSSSSSRHALAAAFSTSHVSSLLFTPAINTWPHQNRQKLLVCVTSIHSLFSHSPVLSPTTYSQQSSTTYSLPHYVHYFTSTSVQQSLLESSCNMSSCTAAPPINKRHVAENP